MLRSSPLATTLLDNRDVDRYGSRRCPCSSGRGGGRWGRSRGGDQSGRGEGVRGAGLQAGGERRGDQGDGAAGADRRRPRAIGMLRAARHAGNGGQGRRAGVGPADRRVDPAQRSVAHRREPERDDPQHVERPHRRFRQAAFVPGHRAGLCAAAVRGAGDLRQERGLSGHRGEQRLRVQRRQPLGPAVVAHRPSRRPGCRRRPA